MYGTPLSTKIGNFDKVLISSHRPTGAPESVIEYINSLKPDYKTCLRKLIDSLYSTEVAMDEINHNQYRMDACDHTLIFLVKKKIITIISIRPK